MLFFILGYFLPFYPPDSPKNQNLKKNEKNTWRYHHFTCVPKIMIRWHMVPEIWCAMDGQTDRRTDGKSDIQRWVPHLKRNVYYLPETLFMQITRNVLSESKSAILPLFHDAEVLLFWSNRTQLVAKSFFEYSNLDKSSITLPKFPSETRSCIISLKLITWLKKS